MFRFLLCALATGALWLTTTLSNAATPEPANAFSKHGLPVPGACFKNEENLPAAVVVTKPGKSVTTTNPPALKAAKKSAKHPQYATS